VLLDIGGHLLALPGRKAATSDWFAGCGVAVDADYFMRQQDSERVNVLAEHRARVFDLRLELESSLPEISIAKEQARPEFNLAEPQGRIGKRSAWIDVEINRAV
jgi:hypothetical protein